MATTIKLKNSVTTTNTPTSLVQGEVAINITDKKVWVGNAATTPIQLLGDGGSASFTSIAFGAGTVSNPSITFTGDTNTGIYSPAADTIAFTEGGVESMRIDSSGNVGIGNSSPSHILDVSNTSATNKTFRIGQSSGSATASSTVIISNGGTGDAMLRFDYEGTNTDRARIGVTASNQALQFFTAGNNERMRIDSSGNVAIGRTSSISYKLDVDAGAGSAARLLSNNAQVLIGYNSTSFNYYDADTQIFRNNAGTERMRITSAGVVGIGTSSPSGKLQVKANTNISLYVGNSGLGSMEVGNYDVTDGYNPLLVDGSYVAFATGTAGGQSVTERMRIDSSGNVLIGTTATQNISGVNTDHTFIGTTNTNRWVSGFINNSASSPYGLAVSYTGSAPNATGNQFLFCRDTGGTRFEVRSNGGIANYSANDVNLSDEREKTNIQLAGSYLDKICAIPIKKFKYIDQNRETDDGLTLGVIAQDVQAVAPELVMESNWAGKDEPEKMRLSIYQTDLQYALMKAIQEQQAMIEELKQEVAKLKGV